MRHQPGTRMLCAAFAYAAALSAIAQPTVYVDAGAVGPAHDGASWCTAYLDLSTALTVAAGDPNVLAIHVAHGAYVPVPADGADPRSATFTLLDGVLLAGGYAGCGAPDPDARDFALYETVLSGDLNGDDGPDFANNAENCYHVVTADHVDEAPILDGFTIRGGNANGGTSLNGGGLRIYYTEITIRNCLFTSNHASNTGGALYADQSRPALLHCDFIGNGADGNGGGIGATSYVLGSVTNCRFNGNAAGSKGGGAYAPYLDYHVDFKNCAFSGNSADFGGGALASWLTNCTFAGNTATTRGGAVDTTYLTARNCIFWGDSAPANPELYASISTYVMYSCVQGGWTDTGNIDLAPLFIDADGADDILGTADDDLRPSSGSPVIDQGDTTLAIGWIDAAGNYRRADDPATADGGNGTAPIVDMGAYEYASTPVPSRLFVNKQAVGAGTGATWAAAIPELRDALQCADESAGVVTAVWVAAGTYTPAPAPGPYESPDRSASFHVRSGLALYGGFTGDEDPLTFDLHDRDFAAHETILSGDITGLGGPAYDRSQHVVRAERVDATAVIDGFTVAGGSADTSSGREFYGGGMYIVTASPTLSNCVFRNNMASIGAGVCIRDGSSPTLTNCAFIKNAATSYHGGLSCLYDNSPTLINCLFLYNSASRGGALGSLYGAHLSLINCTCYANKATSMGGTLYNQGSTATLANCVLWANTPASGPQISDDPNSATTATYSCIQDGWPGLGNIAVDPTILVTAGPDGYLETADDVLYLLNGSPCIDAGNNAAVPAGIFNDIQGHPRFLDDPATPDTGAGTPPLVDMGTQEFVFPGVIDLNGDGRVDLVDYDLFAACWSRPALELSEDCELRDFYEHVGEVSDGAVDMYDIAILQKWYPDEFLSWEGCITGPVVFDPACSAADFRQDGDADLVDFALLQCYFVN